jgi:predicted O-methyltransferase YrrM
MSDIALKKWTAEELLELGRSYQAAAVMAAAADLDLFPALARGPRSAAEVARELQCDLRGLTLLLDALAGLDLAEKQGEFYSLVAGTAELLSDHGPASILPMAQHQANCLRHWAQLARVVKSGHPAEHSPSVRGEKRDAEAFIGAMHSICAPIAGEIVQAVQPLRFRHLLDVGGASGTWTMAFLRAYPEGRATLFDLPHVIDLAETRLAEAGLAGRVRLVAGDFMVDPLPGGADLVWVSAIVHQNSRAQNRQLFANVFGALVPEGRIAIRDLVMEPSRTRPVAGALFALNMLVATPGGGTFTFEELREDLEASGFTQVRLARPDQTMNAVVVADKRTVTSCPQIRA